LLSREIGDRRREGEAGASLIAVSLHLGRIDEARETIERSSALGKEIGYRSLDGELVGYGADVAAEEGRDADAESALSSAIGKFDGIGDANGGAATRVALGALVARAGRTDEARGLLVAAVASAREAGVPGTETAALAHLATLPGGDAVAAEDALARNGSRLTTTKAMDVRLALFRATGKRDHLVEAKRLLDDVLAANPESDRAPMLANVRLNREIAAAAKAAGL
jgi:tetratricopeptide (TPR) repeat protein